MFFPRILSHNVQQCAFIFFCAPFLIGNFAHAQPSSVTLENDCFRYVIGSDGRNQHFIDKLTGTDYCDHSAESYCARIKKDKKEYNASFVSYDGNKLRMEFAGTGIKAVLQTTVYSKYIKLEVTSVEGGAVESFVFLDIPLTLKGMPHESFAACAFSLNLRTKVMQLPALQSHLRASCSGKFGLVEAKAALIGVPREEILDTIKDVISKAEELPQCPVGGAWAQETPFNHGSYLFNFGELTEANIDEWIDMVKSIGFTQIDHHGGSRFFRWGDFRLDPEKFPRGWDSMKDIVARLHEEGIGSIFHTYNYFIDKESKYVTPVPHPQLDSYRSFTLAEPLSADATEIHVNESTSDISTTTGWAVNNSVTLHIGDELITFSGVTKNRPYKFTGCTRGAYGTKVSSHPKGAQVRHIKEFMGLFIPALESDLSKEILQKQAEIINYCDFDGIYIDGWGFSVMMENPGDFNYYCSKFVFEIYKRLKKPVGMEYSTMFHHLWLFRSRWQAWDYPNRGHKRFIDVHINGINRGLLVPLFLGWWKLLTWNPPQGEPTFPDVIEYLGCKLIGHNAGLSLHGGVDRESMREFPAYRKLAGILKNYEDLKHADYFDETVRERLREPGKEFTLFQDSDGKWRFRPVQFDCHKVEGINHRSSTWKVNNPFDKQPVKLRIEALMSAGTYDSPESVLLADFAREKDFSEKQTADGVTFTLQPSSEQVKTGSRSGCFSSLNSGSVSQNGAWAKAGMTFEPCLDLGTKEALGVWIHGDGQGELLNFRLQSPFSISFGAIADHYVKVDFTGWRYFELIETESTLHSDYSWPEGSAMYHVYREFIDYENVETLSIWYNNLPSDKEVKCYLSPVKALPMIPIVIKNPKITVNNKTLAFPVEMESGSYLEFYSTSECKLYGPKGELLAEVTPQGEIPNIESGTNSISFTADGPVDVSARANVTVISYDKPLK